MFADEASGAVGRCTAVSGDACFVAAFLSIVAFTICAAGTALVVFADLSRGAVRVCATISSFAESGKTQATFGAVGVAGTARAGVVLAD